MHFYLIQLGFLNGWVNSHRSSDTTTAPQGEERKLCWQDAQNSGRKCNILAAWSGKAPFNDKRGGAGDQIAQRENLLLPGGQLSDYPDQVFPFGSLQPKCSI